MTYALPVRDVALAVDPNLYDTEADSGYAYSNLQIDPAKTALIVIDPWAAHPNDGWLARAQDNMQNFLVPVIDRCRARGIRVVYAPTSQPIASIVTPQSGDTIINTPGNSTDDALLDQYLTAWGVDTLLYAGYATNMCVIDKPAGARKMYQRAPSRRFVLIRDATIGFEMPDTLANESLKLGAIFDFEYVFGVSTTTAEFLAATA